MTNATPEVEKYKSVYLRNTSLQFTDKRDYRFIASSFRQSHENRDSLTVDKQKSNMMHGASCPFQCFVENERGLKFLFTPDSINKNSAFWLVPPTNGTVSTSINSPSQDVTLVIESTLGAFVLAGFLLESNSKMVQIYLQKSEDAPKEYLTTCRGVGKPCKATCSIPGGPRQSDSLNQESVSSTVAVISSMMQATEKRIVHAVSLQGSQQEEKQEQRLEGLTRALADQRLCIQQQSQLLTVQTALLHQQAEQIVELKNGQAFILRSINQQRTNAEHDALATMPSDNLIALEDG
ncbi:hypothetical protein MPSEU_000600500 [Mayamaea pseudoterrestris]|nr:hypothetical protein MPSEU_000600500 [Mayamaea pseudoterrestris]